MCSEALRENQYDKPQGPQNARMTHLFIFFELMLTWASDVSLFNVIVNLYLYGTSIVCRGVLNDNHNDL